MTVQTGLATTKIGDAQKKQVGHALHIQHYCNSVLIQPDVDLSAFSTLKKYGEDINTGLAAAKEHAHFFLDNVEPALIDNSAAISNYFAMHSAVATTLPAGATKKEWLNDLNILLEQAQTYQNDAKSVAGLTIELRDKLAVDTASFKRTVQDMNTAATGDNSVLSSLEDDLDKIQTQINGEIAGAVVAGLAIIGGVLMVAAGTVGSFLTAGTSLTLAAGGVAVIAGGAAGEYAAVKALQTLYEQKATIIHQKSDLKEEVKFALALSGSYMTLGDHAETSVTYANDMHNAWQFLSSDLGQVISDLEKGIEMDAARKIFLSAANNQLKAVTKDLDIIKTQLAGVKVIPVAANEMLFDAVGRAVA